MILFLNGSPRKNGVTTSLLNIIAGEARSAGAEVEWVDVNKLSIRPCIGCLKCRPDKKCIFPRDDGHRMGELLESCSALVVGAPTYWGNMPGTLKILFERNVPVLEYYELYTWRLPRPRHKGEEGGNCYRLPFTVSLQFASFARRRGTAHRQDYSEHGRF